MMWIWLNLRKKEPCAFKSGKGEVFSMRRKREADRVNAGEFGIEEDEGAAVIEKELKVRIRVGEEGNGRGHKGVSFTRSLY
jgi:hypothetical protein